ncbi:MAG: hypothetical protein K0S46_2189 [Moraxellaceae bacterium]|nr:hypothetical protein [Moraxellaceae bacterium]
MKNINKNIKRMSAATLALATALATLVGPVLAEGNRMEPATSENARGSGSADDVVISSKIRSAMAGDDRFKEADIDVQTVNGTVVLTGTANSDDARRAAEEVARHVGGVTKVDNRIATPTTRNTMREDARDTMQKSERVASDSWITTKVKSALLADRITKGMNIGVKTMNGTVSLIGEVDSQVEYDRAIQVAKEIEGAREVDASQLRVGGAE